MGGGASLITCLSLNTDFKIILFTISKFYIRGGDGTCIKMLSVIFIYIHLHNSPIIMSSQPML